ncbi:hypothetical protein HHK36_004728 [Tetracentron sinense]|uniref:non-specific serine/threonine protein kinase n=1 Tax=Tetracentron sinense TaxID=13715 RepID=A0A834ZJM7_TETSI|nr:hypothetical protein HHK36_004728 [Tetracentron sinense]
MPRQIQPRLSTVRRTCIILAGLSGSAPYAPLRVLRQLGYAQFIPTWEPMHEDFIDFKGTSERMRREFASSWRLSRWREDENLEYCMTPQTVDGYDQWLILEDQASSIPMPVKLPTPARPPRHGTIPIAATTRPWVDTFLHARMSIKAEEKEIAVAKARLAAKERKVKKYVHKVRHEVGHLMQEKIQAEHFAASLQKVVKHQARSKKDANFSIKCGGNEMRSSKGVVFEADNSTLGPASYFVDNTQKWAVSNVGLFAGKHDSEYGNRQLQDFDIRKEVGGSTNRALQKNFKAQVSENYLIIHLFWAGKGTCCIPVAGSYGPSISAISVVSDFQPTGNGLPPTTASRKKNKTGLIVGILVSVGVVSFLLIFAVLYFIRERSGIKEDEDLLGIGPRPNRFSYAELRTATEDFNPKNKLGEGGFGPVYKGILHDGRVVAVKQLSVASQQGKRHFVAEIATISAVQHRNLVKLYGFCIKGDKKLLVYEYLENKSLDQALFDLLQYMLRDSKRHLTEKADALGFGVVAMEILSGRPNSDSSLDAEKIYLLEWAWTLHENNRVLELVDPILTKFDKSEAIRVMGVALLCTQASPSLRPPMSRIVAMLAGDIEVNTVTTRPGYLTDWQFNDITGSSSGQDGIPTSLASRNTNSLLNASTAPPSVVVDPNPSPINITQHSLHEIIGDGR